MSGNDTINAGTGDDRIYGGKGNDTLTGGQGDDYFVYRNSDSGYADSITDFTHGDKLDFRGFDSNTLSKGAQSLLYLGEENFTGTAGEIRIEVSKSSTKVLVDADGDKKSDLSITIKTQTNIEVTDFLGVHANHTYQVATVDEGITWAQAEAVAEAKGGHLATITSSTENKEVFKLVSKSKYWSKDQGHGAWLGGYQDANASAPNEGWHWVTGEKWKFTSWVMGNPDDGGLPVVKMP